MPGGVCAVLDYDPDLMAEYVSEMAMRVIVPDMPVTNAFKKFVAQILTSTRLPKTTILLGMNYLAKRVNMLNAHCSFKAEEGQAWRMLTVALLLGSKFLDDNTFQNRSWSEVSGIPVSELNSMENDWLRHISWCLYVNLDHSHDFNAWLKSWQEWQQIRKRQQLEAQQQKAQSMARQPLAPIVTSMRNESVRQHHPMVFDGCTHEEIAEHERERYERNAKVSSALAAKAGYRSREGSWHNQQQQSWQQSAPITPPDSGYGTPEHHLNSAASCGSRFDDWFSQANLSEKYQKGYHAPHSQPAYGAPRYVHAYWHGRSPESWEWDAHANSHAPDCPCGNCMSQMHRFRNASSFYAPQYQGGRPMVI